MTEINSLHDDEINLFELFEKLWEGKWRISVFVVIAVLLGGGFWLLKDPAYESKLIYSVKNIPTYYSESKVLNDFKYKFYSITVFEEWKQSNIDTSLDFEDISFTKVVDGFKFSKDENDGLVKMISEKKGDSFLLIKSNHIPILDDIYKYAVHINKLLNNEYVDNAQKELKIIYKSFDNFNDIDSAFLENILPAIRYLSLAEKEAGVFAVQRPTIPRKVSPKSSVILTLSVVLGGMVGAMYVLILNAIRKRKEYLASA